jgi:succinate-acetate transporter protein
MSTTTTTADATGRPIAERPIAPDPTVADPAPLGLAAFALTTFVLSLANANVWETAAGAAVALALAYGGTVQLLAGMWEFKRNNTFGATAFSSYGGFWLSFFFLVHILKVADHNAIGAYLLGWTIFTAYMTVGALRVSGAVTLVFVLLTVTFLLLTLGELNHDAGAALNNWTKAGGWVGIATAAAAWYASFAGVVNSTFKRVVLPVFPLTA